MKIERIHTSNTNITFEAGKVRVFSDFDKTFLPSSHEHFVGIHDERFVKAIRENFKSFKEFLDNTREGLKFTITTGRTFGEFLTMAEIARVRKFGMPLPDTLIVKNGSDEHIKVGTDEDFYNGGEFPFKYEVTNKEKEKEIKKISGWDGAKVKQILKDVFNSYNLRIVEADSEHSVEHYGSRSLFSEGKLPYEVGKVFHETDKADWSVGLRKDGNLKVYSLLPVDMREIDERRKAWTDIQEQIVNKFHEEGIKFSRSSEGSHDVNARPCLAFTPDIGYHEELTKLYDTRQAVKEAAKNNDLVIVAGDSKNDIDMLNPGLHLQDFLTEDILNRHDNMLLDNPVSLIKVLDKDPELAEIFIKMPYRGVIVRHHGGKVVQELLDLEPFTKGKYQKIVVVDEGELQSGIKQSIKMYCEQNPKYKEKLSSDLNKQLDSNSNKPIGTDPNKPTDSSPNEQTDSGSSPNGDEGSGDSPKSGIWKYILAAVGLVGICGGAYIRNKKKNKDLKNDITNQHGSQPAK